MGWAEERHVGGGHAGWQHMLPVEAGRGLRRCICVLFGVLGRGLQRAVAALNEGRGLWRSCVPVKVAWRGLQRPIAALDKGWGQWQHLLPVEVVRRGLRRSCVPVEAPGWGL